MPLLRPLVTALTALLIAACGNTGGNGGGASTTISIASYATSCTQDSDCLAVQVGAIGCCGCPNAAINKADSAKYESDLTAARGAGDHACSASCTSCPVETAVCSGGTCGLAQRPDGGGATCGTATCSSYELCVMDLFQGGVPLTADAGACPSGTEANDAGLCAHTPSYHCAQPPAECAASVTCACVQSLCDTSYTCQTASAELVECVESVP